MKKIVLFLLFQMCVAHAEKVGNSLIHNPDVAGKTMTDVIPLLKQNLREFGTLSLQYTEEKSDDGKKWELVSASSIKWDIKKDFFKSNAIIQLNSIRPFYIEYSIIDGKRVALQGEIPGTIKTLPVDISKLIKPIGGIQKIDTAGGVLDACVLSGLDLWCFYFHASGETLLDLFNEKKNQGSLSSIVVKDGTASVSAFSFRKFIISLSNGMVTKILRSDDDSFGMEATEFAMKRGWLIPTTILTKVNGIYVKRQKIDPDSIEINKPFSLRDFSVTIPRGVKIYDDIKGIDFQAPHPISSLDIKDVEGELLEIIKRANKEAK